MVFIYVFEENDIFNNLRLDAQYLADQVNLMDDDGLSEIAPILKVGTLSLNSIGLTVKASDKINFPLASLSPQV